MEYRTFSHDAMSTTFEIRVAGPAETYKTQAAREAFVLLDRLDQCLSRFRENSDITRLNLAPVGESVLLSLETFACLNNAKSLFDTTKGALDVTLGRQTAKHYDGKPAEARPFVRSAERLSGDDSLKAKTGMAYLKLNSETMTATRLSEAVQIDLGAIGKGFALDRMAERLRQWKLTRCLLHGGSSTVLAMDALSEDTKGWPVTVSCPTDHNQTLALIDLQHSAFSGSSQVQRIHIINPETGDYVRDRTAAWALAPDAVTADGLSTAFMILPEKHIRELCQKEPYIGAAVIFAEKETTSPCELTIFGHWPQK